MKKLFFLTALAFVFHTAAQAQESNIVTSKPCYTKQWVDSVNTSNATRFRETAPSMFEWYSYDGQTQPIPVPASLINVIKVKLEETCPQLAKKTAE
ncbi:MAG: hypothetical protein IPP71_00280 [Bacteroidetes bacterium]|nr:hypothetical protein [Bacteroidota bacterium]